MSKIPLRQYIRDIEGMIDRGQIEEALAHCKYILQSYPKCIDVYRMLGKAYLETQRYTEAADILQRVLSSVPDDFVAHVGMSIVKEDAGDLNAAIWHMERGYEAQPSNGAVQEELRRLYGRRDGSEPPKIRMTRGALVRMYARGHLYEQAVAEVKAALAEDPDRPDLQVLLAHLYAQTGMKVEAATLCGDLVARFPYCYEANRILAEVLPASTRAEEIAAHHQRVVDLDPYMEFAKPGQPAEEVPDQSVALERLEWESGQGEMGQPHWASNLGITVEPADAGAHVLPDWLASLSEIAPAAAGDARSAAPLKSSPSTFTQSEQPAAVPVPADNAVGGLTPETQPPSGANKDIPDWMKSAGWSYSTNPPSESPFVMGTDEEEGEAVLNTDLPDWLKSLAPEDSSETSDGSEEEAAEQFAWLDDLTAAGSAASSLREDEAGQTAPEWMQQPGEISPVEAVPSGEAEPTPESALAEPPVWSGEELKYNPQTAAEGAEVPFEIPEWIENRASTETEETEISPAASLPAEEPADTTSWLEDLALQHTSQAPTLVVQPGDRTANPPSWINELRDSAGEEAQPSEGVPSENENPVEEPPPAPIATHEVTSAGSYESPVEEPAAVANTVPEISKGEEIPIEEVPEIFPDWLMNLADHASDVAAIPAEQTPMPEMPSQAALETDTPAIDEQQAAMAWLDHLNAMGLDAPEPFDASPTSATKEYASAWIAEDFSQTSGETVELPPETEPETPTPEAELEPAGADIALPDWLNRLDQLETPDNTPASAEALVPEAAGMEQAELPQVAEEGAAPEEPAENVAQMTPEIPLETKIEEIPQPVNAVDEADEAAIPAEIPLPEAAPIDTISTPVEEPAPLPAIEALPPTEAPVEELPAWLQELESSLPSENNTTEIPAPPAEAVVGAGSAVETIETPPQSEQAAEAPADSAEAVVEETQPLKVSAGSAEVVPVEPFEAAPEAEIPAAEAATPVPDTIESQKPAAEALPETATAAPSPSVEDQPAPEAEAMPEPVELAQPVLEAPEPAHVRLEDARQALEDGRVDEAAGMYDQVIQRGDRLEETVQSLKDALDRHPVDVNLWQLLGDAHLRSNSLQAALDAYTKAEELIR